MRLSKVALDQAPHARLEAAISRLVVALPQPREDAENPRVSLRCKCPIGALEGFTTGNVLAGENIPSGGAPRGQSRDDAPRPAGIRGGASIAAGTPGEVASAPRVHNVGAMAQAAADESERGSTVEEPTS